MIATLKYSIDRDGHGQGGFMSPPGHPNHVYTVKGKRPRARDWDEITGIEYVLSNPDQYPATLVDQCRKIMDDAQLNISELWIRNVYGYFRNMWTRDGQMWTRTDDLDSAPQGACPPGRWDYHAATVFVRQWYPGHEAREDLIKDPGKGYGSYPCKHCDQHVQYEPRWDALAVYGSNGAECPVNGTHEV
jgi:hypothetical protein